MKKQRWEEPCREEKRKEEKRREKKRRSKKTGEDRKEKESAVRRKKM